VRAPQVRADLAKASLHNARKLAGLIDRLISARRE
jgi:hypothetical protein